MHKNQRGNFVGQKKKKTAKRTRFQAKTAEVGCVLGAGGDESGCGQAQTDAKTHCLNQCEHHNHTTHRKRKPAETQCFRRFFGRGRRTRSTLPLRSVRSLRATGTHSLLGTRFWSGCGNKIVRTAKGRCCPVPAASPREGGAGLVLRGNLVGSK